MKNLTALLDRFKRSLNRDEGVKEAVRETILHHTGLELPLEAIALKDGILSLTASPAARSELMLKEGMLLEEIKARRLPVTRLTYR